MEDVELLSPFKSPSDLPASSRRRRRGSGSSVSSPDKEGLVSPNPRNRPNFFGTTVTAASPCRTGSEGGDENDPPDGCGNGNGGGDSSRVNPFEKDVLAGLQGSFWSPSILEINDTPPQRSWAIEHLAQLFPKDIENSPSTHQNSFPVDAQMEAKAQADIDEYFSRGPIVPTPSPMKQQVINVQGEIIRLKTTNTDVHYGQSPIARGGLNGGNIKKLKKPVSVTERWTQTAISLPVNLPLYVETMLYQYSQDVESCGSSGEANIAHCSQKSEVSDHAENGDTNDSGKNSSSLNNSIRRRLELSFGEDPDGEESSQGSSQQGLSASPITDPFRRNHVVSTPPNPSCSHLLQMNTTTTDLEVQLMRCEFTPEPRGGGGAGGISFTTTPGITPIHDEQQQELKSMYHHCSSTPRRNNSTVSKRWLNQDQLLPPTSSMEEPASSSSTSFSSSLSPSKKVGNNNENVSHQSNNNVLRRARADDNERVHNKKRSSAASFDDSQILMDDSSPPAKLWKRNSKNEDEMSDS